MKYFVHAQSKMSQAQVLALTLQGKPRDVTVYVVGVEDEAVLGQMLAEGAIDLVKLAPKVRFVETIGVPDAVTDEAKLIKFAEQRIKVLEAKHAA